RPHRQTQSPQVPGTVTALLRWLLGVVKKQPRQCFEDRLRDHPVAVAARMHVSRTLRIQFLGKGTSHYRQCIDKEDMRAPQEFKGPFSRLALVGKQPIENVTES